MSDQRSVNVVVVGATGAVGEVIIELLESRSFPVKQLYLLASDRTAGTTLPFQGKSHQVTRLNDFDFSLADIAIFVAKDEVSQEFVPKATATGCVVLDNSRCFINRDDVPLVIPEVNGEALANYKKSLIVANPDSVVIQLWSVLKPLYDAVGIERVNVSTYQSVSGHGKRAIHELASQTASLLNGQGVKTQVYNQQIAFNVLPFVGNIDENGYSSAEIGIIEQTRKIMNDQQLMVNPTCVQVPVFYADSLSISVETGDAIDAADAREILEKSSAISIVDNIAEAEYATPVGSGAGENAIFVSRIRNDLSHGRGLNLWVVGDNVRKGAALNTVQVAEELIKSYL